MSRVVIACLCVILFVFFGGNRVSAQKMTRDGKLLVVAGKVWNNKFHFPIASAVIYINTFDDNKLLNLVSTDKSGTFVIDKIPKGIKLKLVVYADNFSPYDSTFTLADTLSGTITLQSINLERKDTTGQLEEVTVRSARPMRMNKDTLEFNADAFRLDSNAVIEDLLNKIPNIVVWNDGTITVNGKEVKSIMVNGRPFLSGKGDIARKNIPKSSVEKIQVYQKNNERSITDSSLEINIKLKEGKDKGIFGKMGYAQGNKDRFSEDGMVVGYTNHTKLAIAEGKNNINKSSSDINTLLQVNSYSTSGLDINYNPNFSETGIRKPTMIGLSLQKALETARGEGNLDLQYFGNMIRSSSINNTLTQFLLNSNNALLQSQSGSLNTKNNNHDVTLTYRFGNPSIKKIVEQIGVSYSDNHMESRQEASSSQSKNGVTIGLQNSLENAYAQNRSLRISISPVIGKTPLHEPFMPIIKTYYRLRVEKKEDSLQSKSDFTGYNTSYSGAGRYNRYNRKRMSNVEQHLDIETPQLFVWLFGSFFNSIHNPVRPSLTHNITMENRRVNRSVFDGVDAVSYTKLNPNSRLTYENRLLVVNPESNLRFQVNKSSSLPSRYKKDLSISWGSKFNTYLLSNRSTDTSQILRKDFFYVLPYLGIKRQLEVTGGINRSLNIEMNTAIQYPDIDQLIAIPDSSLGWGVLMGNKNLRPVYNKRLYVNYEFDKFYNAYKNVKLNTYFGITNSSHNIIMSTSYDSIGRWSSHYVNSKDNQSLSQGATLTRSLKQNDKQILTTVNIANNFSRSYIIVDNIESRFYNFNSSLYMGIDYTFKKWRAIINNTVSYNCSWQDNQGANAQQNIQWVFDINNSLQVFKNITWVTSGNMRNYYVKGTNGTHIFLLNTVVSCRLLQKKNLEFKFSAFDIFRQNKNVFVTNSAGHQNKTTTNGLTNFYMITASFFPRYF